MASVFSLLALIGGLLYFIFGVEFERDSIPYFAQGIAELIFYVAIIILSIFIMAKAIMQIKENVKEAQEAKPIFAKVLSKTTETTSSAHGFADTKYRFFSSCQEEQGGVLLFRPGVAGNIIEGG